MPGGKNQQQIQYIQWIRTYPDKHRAKNGFASESSREAYETLELRLRELLEYTDRFFVEDEEGEYPKVRREDYDELIRLFTNVSQLEPLLSKDLQTLITAKTQGYLDIPGGLNSPKTLLNLAQPLLTEGLKGPGKQDVKADGMKVEGMKVEGMKAEGPEVKGPAAGM